MVNCKSFIEQCNANLKLSDEDCKHAYQYLINDRQITEQTISDFSIGYCRTEQKPSLLTLIKDEVKRKSIPSILARIVVPIYSEFGSVMGFATRIPSRDAKGWWNTWFDKMNHLFMLNMAKKHMFNNNKVYVCEGYFDGISFWQNGIKNVCCLMSTHLGYRKIGLLARYCEHICLCFDSDEVSKAGQNAQKKAIYEMYKYGWSNISVVNCPNGLDPDTFIMINGKDAILNVEKQLSNKDIVGIAKQYEYKSKHLQKNHNNAK